MMPTRVALLAGRRRSPASLLMLAALDRLRSRNIEVAAVLCVSELRWSRVRDWYLRFGWQAVRKAIREISGGSSLAGVDDEHIVLREKIREWSVTAKSLPELCRQRRIPFHVVPDINGPQALRILAECRCDYGVYSGAGILRQPLLDQFFRGVLNLHCGSLPEIRGMNGVEWNLFCGKSPEVTLHYIDPGIDTGRIVASRVIDVVPQDRLGRLRGKTIVAGIELLAELLPQVHQLPTRDNPAKQGRQYFAMAETLKVLINDRLSQQTNPTPATRTDAVPEFSPRAA
jgi:hypothetical protein